MSCTVSILCCMVFVSRQPRHNALRLFTQVLLSVTSCCVLLLPSTLTMQEIILAHDDCCCQHATSSRCCTCYAGNHCTGDSSVCVCLVRPALLCASDFGDAEQRSLFSVEMNASSQTRLATRLFGSRTQNANRSRADQQL